MADGVANATVDATTFCRQSSNSHVSPSRQPGEFEPSPVTAGGRPWFDETDAGGGPAGQRVVITASGNRRLRAAHRLHLRQQGTGEQPAGQRRRKKRFTSAAVEIISPAAHPEVWLKTVTSRSSAQRPAAAPGTADLRLR
jgi:hypothetical protein